MIMQPMTKYGLGSGLAGTGASIITNLFGDTFVTGQGPSKSPRSVIGNLDLPLS